MSVRAIGGRLLRHGTACVRLICRRNFNSTTIAEKVNAIPTTSTAQATNAGSSHIIPRNFALRNVGLQFGLHARRILIDNVLNRVTNSLAAQLRKQAAKRILFGDSGPFFALVGVSLASGTGILTKEEELEGVCWEIREAVSKIKWTFHDVDVEEKQFENDPVTLKDLSLGKPIAKGASGAVYTAQIQKSEDQQRKEHDGSGDFEIIQKSDTEDQYSIAKHPFAVKMMFNYDIQSNAMAILKAMYRETVPARMYYSNVGVSDWEMDLTEKKKHLPPHPNVVAMFSVFTDYVTELQDAVKLYPAALPARLHPDGEGRNMSLFLLMKRYHCSLQSYLETTKPSIRTSLLLLTQLLEGISHLVAHEIAHRDLKSDNLLLDLSEPDAPILVITDFGCCLADRVHGLYLPYSSHEIDRGGNAALMAPEIINQRPGTFSVLNYTKADLWAAGTIAYEIFGCKNPFYDGPNSKKLRNVSYKEEELSELPEEVPTVVKALIRNLLRRSTSRRLDADTAATICQLILWAPSSWLRVENTKYPSSTEILQWLLTMTTKVLCEARLSNKAPVSPADTINSNQFSGDLSFKKGRRTYPEYLLICSFLTRTKLSTIRSALNWIHNNQ